MGEELIYRCQRCRAPFVGMSRGLFVAGMLEGTFCSMRCLAVWGEAHLENVERAMLEAYHEVEKGGHG